jgi:hypothetical protein
MIIYPIPPIILSVVAVRVRSGESSLRSTFLEPWVISKVIVVPVVRKLGNY